jgi:hypothetical protein
MRRLTIDLGSSTSTTTTMHKTTITIRETALGWLNQHTGRYYAAAGSAYAAVLRADRKVEQGAITAINWMPSTSAGLAAVRTIGAK